jgi:hypothetical protein
MSFLVPLGLLVGLAVALPLVAHLLRRRKPLERAFPPARLVPTAPPVARRRAHLEDRFLLALRALAVAALALLAASPLVRCSRLSLDRRGGASVALALVIDDSMSMRAQLPKNSQRSGAKSRYDLALVAAQEISASLRSGDLTTIVLAGAPARVALPPTGDPGAVRALLEQLAKDGPSDRATDLDGAVALAAASLQELPHGDRRVVLLSDLADGNADGPNLQVPPVERLTLEAPLEALRATPDVGMSNCGIVSATSDGDDSVRVRVACALHGGTVGSRAIELVRTGAAALRVGVAAFPPDVPLAPATFEVVVPIDSVAKAQGLSLGPDAGRPSVTARITGASDAIAIDDSAPVLGVATAPVVAVVVGEAGALDEIVATGGAPVLERALTALDSGAAIRPIPSIPDREADLATFAALAIDDPAGLGPESRESISRWVEHGGLLLLGLGPRAASPPLGQTLEPFLAQLPHWEKIGQPLGVDPAHAGPLADGTSAPLDLAPKGRAQLDRGEPLATIPGEAGLVVTAKWSDGAPLVVTRAMGQGEAWLVTLPFAPDVSDLPLRPSFLALLDAFVSRAKDRGAGARLEIGKAWTAGAGDTLEIVPLDDAGEKVPARVVPVETTGAFQRGTPRTLGAYLVTVTAGGGAPRVDVRAVAPVPREIDLTPRGLDPLVAAGGKSGLERTTAELTPAIAWVLLLLFVTELGVRAARLWLVKPSEEPTQ